jgi:hypothetical protein
MHQPLETYLNRIKSQLKGIPAAERELQIQEITQHLQRLVAEEMEGGLTEADAVQAAIAQFGEPKEIGRGLRNATGGTKTGIGLGMMMGAFAGIAILQFLWFAPLFLGMEYGTLYPSYWGFMGCAVAALSGAMASLVGRHFTWRHLMRPSGRHPILGNHTRDIAFLCRFFEVGMLSGGIGGGIYAFCQQIWFSYTVFLEWNTQFPERSEGLLFFFHRLDLPSLPYWLGSGVAVGALVVGFLNALVSLGFRVKEKREGRRAWLT